MALYKLFAFLRISQEHKSIIMVSESPPLNTMYHGSKVMANLKFYKISNKVL